jgi:phosphoglycolate phosphatase-like HAD superfamily hydrolase
MNERFMFTENDIEERENLKKVLEIMERRCTAGETQSSDYASAIERRDYEIKNSVNLGKYERVNLLDKADAIFFDWDGVLYNSMKKVCLGAFQQIKQTARGDLKNVSEEEIFHSYSSPFWDYYRRFGIPVETEADKKRIFDYYHDVIYPQLDEQLPEKDDLFPNTAQDIKWLYEEGKKRNPDFKLGIISAGHEERIREILEENGLTEFFEFVRGSQHDKVEAIKEAVESSGLPPEKILYVGDLPSDITDAQKTNTGIKSVAIIRFDEAEARLESYGPDYSINGINKDDIEVTKMFVQNS